MLVASGICKSFRSGGERVEVLAGVDLAAESHEIVLVEGPSGSGKTTLLNILSFLIPPDSGEIYLMGQRVDFTNLESLLSLRNTYIGYCFQDFCLFPTLTVLENVILPDLLEKDFNFLTAKALEVLDKLGIASLASRFPDEISGGELQRTSLARALVRDPKVLLLDEPTANLDRKNAQKIVELVKRIAEEKDVCVVVASHDQLIQRIADKVVSLG